MKKYGALLLAVLSIALFSSQAQAQGVTYGFKAGLNLAGATIKTIETDVPDFKSMIGGVEGIFVNFKLGPVSIQPELLYSQRGTKWDEYADDAETVTGSLKLNYLEIPVLVKYNFLAGPAKPFVLAGPSLGILLSSCWHYDIDYVSEASADYEYSYNMSEYFKKTEFAAVIGAGLDYQLPKILLSVELRYHLGLTNVADADMESAMGVTSAKNKGFSVLIGIGF